MNLGHATHAILLRAYCLGVFTIADVKGSSPRLEVNRRLWAMERCGLLTRDGRDELGRVRWVLTEWGRFRARHPGVTQVQLRALLVLPATTSQIAEQFEGRPTSRRNSALNTLTRLEAKGLARAVELVGRGTWRWERTSAGDREVAA